MLQMVDAHIHALYGVDDGAKTREEMYSIIDASYEQGVRVVCVTPHFYPSLFGDNAEKTERVFRELREYAEEKYEDLVLCLGNELHYQQGFCEWVESGKCKTLNGTDYVLLDYRESESLQTIQEGLLRLLNSGYKPILAHVERYGKLFGRMKELRRLKRDGVLLQLDAGSVLGDFGLAVKWQSMRLLSGGYADFISSDAHNLTSRRTKMLECCTLIQNKYGVRAAEELFRDRALSILNIQMKEVK